MYVVCSLAMGWGKTVIISKDRRVIVNLGERRRATGGEGERRKN